MIDKSARSHLEEKTNGRQAKSRKAGLKVAERPAKGQPWPKKFCPCKRLLVGFFFFKFRITEMTEAAAAAADGGGAGRKGKVK